MSGFGLRAHPFARTSVGSQENAGVSGAYADGEGGTTKAGIMVRITAVEWEVSDSEGGAGQGG